MTGVVYLLHFDRSIGGESPRGRARHYLGFASSRRNLAMRLEHHAAGNGSRLMAAVSGAGIEWELVRTWDGTRDDERRLKNRKEAHVFCPYCKRASA